MKIRKLIAAALSLCMAGGAFEFNAPAIKDYSITADAAGECYTFNSTTGLLTLKGKIVLDEIKGFAMKEDVQKIKTAEGTILPQDCLHLFCDYNYCTSIDLSNADSKIVKNMSYMFENCDSLTSLDLSGFDTRNVTDMICMFLECSRLTSLDLSGFDTSKVTSMNRMFEGCAFLSSLDISSFYTGNVTDMSYMFAECNSLTSLDLSSFNTRKVNNTVGMFENCTALTSLDLSSFDMSSIDYSDGMFSDCTGLLKLTLGKYFGDITKEHELPNDTGWYNKKDTSTVVSGSGEYAEFGNTGVNTYVKYWGGNHNRTAPGNRVFRHL